MTNTGNGSVYNIHMLVQSPYFILSHSPHKFEAVEERLNTDLFG